MRISTAARALTGRTATRGAVAGLLVVGAMTVLPAGPAAAVTKSCHIPDHGLQCTTSAPHLAAHPTAHQIEIIAFPAYLDGINSGIVVTCSAYDASSGDRVGSTTSGGTFPGSKVISGLYGTYYLNCVKLNNAGQSHDGWGVIGNG